MKKEEEKNKKKQEKEDEEEEHRKTNSSRFTGPYKAVCFKQLYLIYSERRRIVKAKTNGSNTLRT